MNSRLEKDEITPLFLTKKNLEPLIDKELLNGPHQLNTGHFHQFKSTIYVIICTTFTLSQPMSVKMHKKIKYEVQKWH